MKGAQSWWSKPPFNRIIWETFHGNNINIQFYMHHIRFSVTAQQDTTRITNWMCLQTRLSLLIQSTWMALTPIRIEFSSPVSNYLHILSILYINQYFSIGVSWYNSVSWYLFRRAAKSLNIKKILKYYPFILLALILQFWNATKLSCQNSIHRRAEKVEKNC